MKKIIFLVALISLLTFALMSEASATTSLTYVYDANGNLIQGDGKYYEYNDANQLVRVRHGDQNGPVIAEYFYDYTGQRIKKIENGVTTYYIGKHYETQVAGESQINSSYYFANGERVAKKNTLGNVYYYHSDHLGGTNAVTDFAGNLVERIKYYPFGEIRGGGNEEYSFTGKEKDKLTEFYYFEARYYNSEFKHFTQADTVEPDLYDPQNLNRYAYVRNNPIKLIDPTGYGWIYRLQAISEGSTHFVSHIGSMGINMAAAIVSGTEGDVVGSVSNTISAIDDFNEASKGGAAALYNILAPAFNRPVMRVGQFKDEGLFGTKGWKAVEGTNQIYGTFNLVNNPKNIVKLKDAKNAANVIRGLDALKSIDDSPETLIKGSLAVGDIRNNLKSNCDPQLCFSGQTNGRIYNQGGSIGISGAGVQPGQYLRLDGTIR